MASHTRRAWRVELRQEHIYTQTVNATIMPAVLPGFLSFVKRVWGCKRRFISCNCDLSMCELMYYTRYGSDAFSDAPCVSASPVKVGKPCQRKTHSALSSSNRLFLLIYLHPPSSPSFLLSLSESHYQEGPSLPNQYPPVDQKRRTTERWYGWRKKCRKTCLGKDDMMKERRGICLNRDEKHGEREERREYAHRTSPNCM